MTQPRTQVQRTTEYDHTPTLVVFDGELAISPQWMVDLYDRIRPGLLRPVAVDTDPTPPHGIVQPRLWEAS